MPGPQWDETAVKATEPTLSIERLISTIEVSFSLLRHENKEQSHGFTVALERLTAAVEKLDPQPQSGDTRTAFWTVYGKLADEFDKEFLQKYGNDLDASLIFAGLFSAVSSAFIIQLQPQFQGDPNATTEALLLLLVQNMTGAVPAIQLSPQPTPVTIVVAQSLLYFSLLSTLLAALLAVLGKQWLLHYDSVGDRGTIEERGLERQRKLDGLRRWKFDLVMQIFPLLLQFSLLLFAVALSVYLWTINLGLAAIVLGITSLGAVFYGLMLLSALVSPDSPFQTSLTTILRILIELLRQKFTDGTVPLQLLSLAYSPMSSLTNLIRPLLPESVVEVFRMKPIQRLFSATFRRSHRPNPSPVAKPSPETSAVTWVLEVSTDPRVVEVAAAFVPQLQWPFRLDLRPSLRRLSDIFNGCFHGAQLREGMGDRASNCMRAFGLLEMVTTRAEGWSKLWTFPHHDISGASRDLRSMIHYFRFPSGPYTPTQPITHWALRFIAARHSSNVSLDSLLQNFNPEEYPNNPIVFADFLFSVSAFFTRTRPQGLSLLDKSETLHPILFTTLKRISGSLRGRYPNLDQTNEIVRRIAGFKLDPEYLRLDPPGRYNGMRRVVYHICGCPGVLQSTATTLLTFTRLGMDTLLAYRVDSSVTIPVESELKDVAWAYRLLAQLDTAHPKDVNVIGDVAQVLFHHIHIRSKPSLSVLRIILSIITDDVADYDEPAQFFAFRVLLSFADQWSHDDELGPALRQHSVWAVLGTFNIHSLHHDITTHYIALGDKLAWLPEWISIIAADPIGWLSHLSSLLSLGPRSETQNKFCVVLSLWGEGEPAEIGVGPVTITSSETTLAMSVEVLVKLWDQLVSPQIYALISLIECTIFTAFAGVMQESPPHLTDQLKQAAIRLGNILADKAANITTPLPLSTELMRRLGLCIKNTLAQQWSNKDQGYWLAAREDFLSNLHELRQLGDNDEHNRENRAAYIRG